MFFLRGSDLGDTCVVVDPWNKKIHFITVSDIKDKMPACGLQGQVTIEFGLDFSNQTPPEEQVPP